LPKRYYFLFQVKALSNSNDTLRLFQDAESARKKQDELIAALRSELAAAKLAAKAEAKRAAASAGSTNGTASDATAAGIAAAESSDAAGPAGDSALEEGEEAGGSGALATPSRAATTGGSSKSPREMVLEVGDFFSVVAPTHPPHND
jgi:hypothetical protein